MDNLVYDSLRLINKILSDTYEDNILVHISQSELLVYSFPASPEIPTCYGYVIDRTPEFLEKNKILKILNRGDYLLPYNRLITYESLKNYYSKLQKTITESYKKFTGEKMDFSRYGFFSPSQKNISITSSRGLCFVVINREEAVKWIETFNQRKEEVNKPNERPYWYENKQLFFKLQNGAVDQLDFSRAEISRKIFEAFYYLWSDGKGKYSRDEIIKKYKEIHKENLETGKIGELVSNINSKIIKPKTNLNERIKWYFEKTSSSWVFNIR